MAQDYDYDWKGQLENLESAHMATLRKSNTSQNGGSPEPAETSRPAQGGDNSSPQQSDKTLPQKPNLNDERTTSKEVSGVQGLDIDATIDEAVELEQQTRLKNKQRNRGKGSKGEVSVEGTGG